MASITLAADNEMSLGRNCCHQHIAKWVQARTFWYKNCDRAWANNQAKWNMQHLYEIPPTAWRGGFPWPERIRTLKARSERERVNVYLSVGLCKWCRSEVDPEEIHAVWFIRDTLKLLTTSHFVHEGRNADEKTQKDKRHYNVLLFWCCSL